MVLVLVIQFVMASPVIAYEPGQFPGKGTWETWQKAGVAYNSGCDLHAAGSYDKAISKFREAILIYPHDASYYVSLGSAYDKRGNAGDLLRAEKEVKTAIRICPDRWRYWAYLGGIVFAIDSNRAPEALADCRKALALNPPADAKAKIDASIRKFEQSLRSKSLTKR